MSFESTAKAMPFAARKAESWESFPRSSPQGKGQGWGLNMAPECSMGLSERSYPKHPGLLPSSVVHLC